MENEKWKSRKTMWIEYIHTNLNTRNTKEWRGNIKLTICDEKMRLKYNRLCINIYLVLYHLVD